MAKPTEKNSEFIWLDGKIVPWKEAAVHVMTNTLHYGTGVFEGIRCYETPDGPAIMRFDEHWDRLYNSAKVVGFDVPFTKEETKKACKDLILRNGFEECYVRPLIFLGNDNFGVNWTGNRIRFSIIVWFWGAYLGEGALDQGVRVKVSSFTRHHPNISMTKAKVCGNYVNSQLAKLDAVQEGYAEALMCDVDGYVVEGTGENIFMIEKGKLITPPLGSVLPGITRECVIEIAENELGLEVKEDRISRDRIYMADEFFFCGTAAEVTPVREVDRRVIGAGKAGPFTKQIQQRYFDAVKGKDPKYTKWLDYVRVQDVTPTKKAQPDTVTS